MDGNGFQATRIAPVGLVPEGLRIEVGFAGTLTTDRLTAIATSYGIEILGAPASSSDRADDSHGQQPQHAEREIRS